MTTPIADLLTSAAASLPPALPTLLMLVKATCLLLAALFASIAMQRAPAGSRHLIWLVALGALLVLPALAAWSPIPMRVLPAAFTPVDAVPATATRDLTSAVDAAANVTPAPAVTTPALAPASSPASIRSLDLGTTLLIIWAVVAFALLVRLAYGAYSVRRIVRRAQLLEHPDWQTPLYEIADRLGIDAAPRLLRSDDVKMPFAAGLLVHTIVLPAESDGWSAERRSAVLIHELGHVRRRDLIGHTLGRIACALYWFHPLVWTAARRLRAESERACDDLALVFGARPSDYAEHLLDIVTCVRNHYTPSVALAMAQRKEFEGRMLAILNPELRRKSLSRLQTASLVGGLAALALVVSAAAPVARVAPVQDVARAKPPAAQAVFADTATAPEAAPASVARTRQQPAARPEAARASATPRPTPAPAPAPAPSPTGSSRVDVITSLATVVGQTVQQTIQQTLSVAQSNEPDDGRAAVLAKTLRTDANAEVRRIAAWGLQRYVRGNDEAANALAAAVGGDADASVREMATWALSRARQTPAATAALMKAVRDRDVKVQATAIWALGNVGDDAAIEALVGALGNPDASVREVAAWAIGSCDPKQAPAALVSALSDANPRVRQSVAWALHNIRDPQTVAALDAAFRRENDSDVRRDLLKAIAANGDASIEVLQGLVTSPDPEVRKVAVAALAGGRLSGPWPWPRPEPRPFP